VGMLTDPYGTSPLTEAIIGCAIRVHRAIGPGVLEKIYSECLTHEFKKRGLFFERERPVPLVYQGVRLKPKFFIDFVVENKVVVELKSVTEIVKVHECQVLTQLKLAELPVGLLINFNVPLLVDGVTRLVNPTLKARETKNI
jgi:GxxExxY protein